MNKKKSLSPAFWFIPLMAAVIACAIVLVLVIGWKLYHLHKRFVPSAQELVDRAHAAQQIPAEQKSWWQRLKEPILVADFGTSPKELTEQAQEVPAQAPIMPFVETEEQETVLPPEVEIPEPGFTVADTAPEDICPATAVPVKIQKPKRARPVTPFEQGLKQCLAGGTFPCAWEDNSRGVIRQYWLMGPQGAVQRGIYDRNGNLISETIATRGGTVERFTEDNTTWYFRAGVLHQIRTSPYDNCNLHDWFFINPAGKQDVCQCAFTQQDCCARSPYKEGEPLEYCKRFPLDSDFCRQ